MFPDWTEPQNLLSGVSKILRHIEVLDCISILWLIVAMLTCFSVVATVCVYPEEYLYLEEKDRIR